MQDYRHLADCNIDYQIDKLKVRDRLIITVCGVVLGSMIAWGGIYIW